MSNEGGGFAAIDDEVAAILAFVISYTMFFSAQDDEMRCTTPEPLIFYSFSKIEYTCKRYTPF